MLTDMQEKYVLNLVKGMTQRQAYRDAYPKSKKWKDEIVDSKASTLFKNEKVRARYKKLTEKVIERREEHAIMSAIERKEWLTKVINGEIEEEDKYFSDGEAVVYNKPANIKTKIIALDTLNKMDGQYIQDIRLSGDKNNPVVTQTNVIDSVARQMQEVNEDDVDVGINS